MTNQNFSHNNNFSYQYRVENTNQVTSAPEQSPIIIPANVETPMILRGPVEATVTGSAIFFEYTNIEAGEFTIEPDRTIITSLYYNLSPKSAEGKMTITIYMNDKVYERFTDYDILHPSLDSNKNVIKFPLLVHESTDKLKITAFTTTENIIFADSILGTSTALAILLQEIRA
ncbi:hypothetical protein HAV_00074 [Candidatus Hepatincola sp. Av]